MTPVTDDEMKILKALLKLQADFEPHSSGGFDPDDISQHAPGMFWESKRIEALLLNELSEEGLVTSVEAPWGEPYLSHWMLTEKGKGVAA